MDKYKLENEEMEGRREDRSFLEYTDSPFLYGGFTLRFLAYLIDILAINSISKIVLTPLINFNIIGRSFLFFTPYKILSLAIYLLYFTLTTKYSNGYTLGKRIMGIRVVSFEEEELSWGTIVNRELLGRFILKRIKLLYLTVIFTRGKQHFGDYLGETYVIREDYVNLRSAEGKFTSGESF